MGCLVQNKLTRTTFVVSNGRYTFYQIHFIKHNLSKTIYQIPFILYLLSNTVSNTIHQISFIKYNLSNAIYQIPLIKYLSSNTIFQIMINKYHLSNTICSQNFFLMNQSMNQWMNQSSISRTAYLPLKIFSPICSKLYCLQL